MKSTRDSTRKAGLKKFIMTLLGVVSVFFGACITIDLKYENYESELVVRMRLEKDTGRKSNEVFQAKRKIQIDSLQYLIEIDSSNDQAHYEMGLVFQNSDYKYARESFKQAVRFDSMNILFNTQLATNYRRDSEYDLAIKQYQIVYRLDPSNKKIREEIYTIQLLK